jgi:predicted  nucleic acid-binding Zn-ribbon protein
MARSTNLYRLQEIDEALRERQERLDEITQMLSEDERIGVAEGQLELAQADFVSARSRNGEAEQAVATQRAKMEKTDRALYGGGVKDPKQLQELQMEATSLKRYMSTLEDRLLDAMVELEQADEAYQQAKAGLEAVQDEVADQHGELREERQRLLAEFERLETEREAAVANVQGEDLEIYRDVLAKVGRRPLALLENGNCSVCGMSIPAGKLQKARSTDELVRCGGCGRILYAG